MVYNNTYYYYEDDWYREVIYEGESGGVQSLAPVGHVLAELPPGFETLQYDGVTYAYAGGSFFQPQPGGGWIVVLSPVGAEVNLIPGEAVRVEDGSGDETYQFDQAYWTKVTNDAGKTVYRVEPGPPEEVIDEIPAGSVSFVADRETYYYVNYNWYVAFDENGKKGFTNGEPDIDAQVDRLPEGTTDLLVDGVTYKQFDTLYFEEVEGRGGKTFYQVVDLDEDGLVEVGG